MRTQRKMSERGKRGRGSSTKIHHSQGPCVGSLFPFPSSTARRQSTTYRPSVLAARHPSPTPLLSSPQGSSTQTPRHFVTPSPYHLFCLLSLLILISPSLQRQQLEAFASSRPFAKPRAFTSSLPFSRFSCLSRLLLSAAVALSSHLHPFRCEVCDCRRARLSP